MTFPMLLLFQSLLLTEGSMRGWRGLGVARRVWPGGGTGPKEVQRILASTWCGSHLTSFPGLSNLSILSENLLAILGSLYFCFLNDPVVLAGLLRSGFDFIFSLNHLLPFFLTGSSEIRPLI